MALPTAAPERLLKHRRSIDVQIDARGNGLWEVDAQVKDTKTYDAALASGIRPAGEPIYDMSCARTVRRCRLSTRAGIAPHPFET